MGSHLGNEIMGSLARASRWVGRSNPVDYARTLAAWSARLSEDKQMAVDLFGADLVRRYRIYLRACQTTFLRRAANLYRIGFLRRDEKLSL